MAHGWIGVDLDGTLAEYGFVWLGPEHIGKPIPAMVERVKDWLAKGYEVKVFTARVSHDNTPGRRLEALRAETAITTWCKEHIGQPLKVTNAKDYAMIEYWDDRAIAVEANTGVILGGASRV